VGLFLFPVTTYLQTFKCSANQADS